MPGKLHQVILLNPPSRDIAIRDNYCSKISQASYINHPIDLLIQSGFLSEHFEIELLDAVVQKLTIRQCLDRIVAVNPYAIFALTGNATWPEDDLFFKDLRQSLPTVRLICSGDIFLESPVEVLNEVPWLDAVLTDYTSDGLLQYLLNRPDRCHDLVFRTSNGCVTDSRLPREHAGTVTFPLPRHDLFLTLPYRYPFVKSQRFATTITEFGCPFSCSFCVMGTLGCKRRPLDEVLDELRHLGQEGVRDIFFLDQSFGSDQPRNMELCHRIRSEIPGLRWLCFSRVDLVNEEILNTMKQAGCHTIIFGVESADEALLQSYRKGYTTDDVRRVLVMAKQSNIRTVATFLLGLPGETWQSAQRTIDFAAALPCTYASLNVAVPRMGTEMRRQAVRKGYVNPENLFFDQSGSEIVMNTETLGSEQLRKLKKMAVRRLYLNPRRMIRMLLSIRSLDELRIHFEEGFSLIKRFAAKES